MPNIATPTTSSSRVAMSNSSIKALSQAGMLSTLIILVAISTCPSSAAMQSSVSSESQQASFQDHISRVLLGPSEWTSIETIAFCGVILLAMEVLQHLTKHLGPWFGLESIPVRGKHLDELSTKDLVYIGISKLQTGPFVYFLLSYWMHEPNILWDIREASLLNAVLPVPVMFIVFDFFYSILHWAFHIKALYGMIHKHHHIQKAPSRAVVDAVNVHPVEFILGEYNHMWTTYLMCRCLQIQIHIIAAIAFVAIGGILAGLNHTRFDCKLECFGVVIYDSKAHDVHHRIPQSNYGQYTVFWDHMFGTFRAYDSKDRVNQMAQLDPKTGKTKQSPD